MIIKNKTFSDLQIVTGAVILTVTAGYLTKLWTDYKSKDPGITTLEALTYVDDNPAVAVHDYIESHE